jgi:hypothetical protein
MLDSASKAFFHLIAQSQTLKKLASRYGMRKPSSFARRFIAGERVAEAIEAARAVEARGLDVTMDLLGESVTSLGKADAATRTRWQEGALPDSKPGKNANASLGRLVTCQNVTMAQFADLLPGIAPGYLRTEVVDNTGLEGGYDFTFSFSPAGVLQIGRGPNGDASSEASEPTGAISLFDAMTNQLGLKLELQKRPMPVLVIDKVERKPTEN